MNLVTFSRFVRAMGVAVAALLTLASASSQVNLVITTVSGTYPSEVGYQLVNTDRNITYNCLAPGSNPSTQNGLVINVPGGNYELRAWDSWGDGWNGASYTLKYQINGNTLLNAVTMASGGGASNTCPGPTDPTTTRGTVLSRFTVVVPCFPPTITAHPTDISACTGTSVSFSVTSNMTAGTYEWRKDGITLATTRSNVYTVSPVTSTSGGFYDVILRDDCNPTTAVSTSNQGRLTVSIAPTITQNPPSSRVACAGVADTLKIRALATGRTFQWRFNGVNIAGATDSNYVIANPGVAHIGSYDCIVSGQCSPSVTSTTCAYDVAFSPVVNVHPTDQTVCPTSNVTLTAGGSVIGGTLTYQWIKNGAAISGANSPTLTLSNVTTADVGRYYCNLIRVGANPSNCNIVTASREVTVSVFSSPRIQTQPSSIEGCLGGAATMSVAVDGFNVTYEWSKNGAVIPNSNSNSISLTNLQASDAGIYTVRVMATCGFSVTSTPATLTVVNRPTFTQMPTSASLTIGQPLTLTIAGTNIGSVKWMKNNKVIANATGLTYSIPSVKLSDAGSYSAMITNTCGSNVSGYAVVTVVDPATLVPELTLAQPSVDAGDVPAEYSRTVQLTNYISNTGKAPLTVSSIDVQNGSGSGTFTVSTGGTTPFTLAPGETRSLNIIFAASGVGSASATLVVGSDDPNGAKSSSLSGNGVLLYSVPPTLTFGKVNINTSLQKCIDVTNTTSKSITIDQAQISGANASLFTVISSFPMTIGAGAATQLCVKYSPTAMGDNTASVKVISSDGGNTTFSLVGNGDDPTSVIEPATATELSAYPNPTSGMITFAGSLVRENTSFIVMNAVGAKVAEIHGSDASVHFDGSALSSGLYTVIARTGETVRSLRVSVIR